MDLHLVGCASIKSSFGKKILGLWEQIHNPNGRYGGTYAHTDIAFEFASWISPEFKLYPESVSLTTDYFL